MLEYSQCIKKKSIKRKQVAGWICQHTLWFGFKLQPLLSVCRFCRPNPEASSRTVRSIYRGRATVRTITTLGMTRRHRRRAKPGFPGRASPTTTTRGATADVWPLRRSSSSRTETTSPIQETLSPATRPYAKPTARRVCPRLCSVQTARGNVVFMISNPSERNASTGKLQAFYLVSPRSVSSFETNIEYIFNVRPRTQQRRLHSSL